MLGHLINKQFTIEIHHHVSVRIELWVLDIRMQITWNDKINAKRKLPQRKSEITKNKCATMIAVDRWWRPNDGAHLYSYITAYTLVHPFERQTHHLIDHWKSSKYVSRHCCASLRNSIECSTIQRRRCVASICVSNACVSSRRDDQVKTGANKSICSKQFVRTSNSNRNSNSCLH